MDFSEIIVQVFYSAFFEENAYLVKLKHDHRCFLIDPGLDAESILQHVENEKLSLEAILITHGHADHFVGIMSIKEQWENCVVYIGKGEEEKLLSADGNLSAMFGFPIVAPPADILLENGETVEIAGIPIEVRHAPGHSAGHVIYLIRTEPRMILFSGDVLFRRNTGRTDFPDGSHHALQQSIQKQIMSLPDDTLVYPGHGSDTTVGEERRLNRFIERN